MPRAPRRLVDRLWENIDWANPTDTGCLLWTGSRTCYGYGGIAVGLFPEDRALFPGCPSRTIAASRAIWALYFGPILAGMCVCHACDNRLCCNPDHLFLGTTQENTDDRIRKGREARGAQSGVSKLTDRRVIAIRKAYSRGDVTYPQLAALHGVDRTTIGRIVRRVIWRHLLPQEAY